MAEAPKTEDRCRRCGTAISAPPGTQEDDLLCSRCRIELAEQRIPDVVEKPKTAPPRKFPIRRIVTILLLILSLAVIVFQFPSLRKAMEDPKPLRQGTYETDAKADACIRNLWTIAKSLQQSGVFDVGLRCPGSGKPYVTKGSGEEMTVGCPNPETHGLRSLSVSRTAPVPEVRP